VCLFSLFAVASIRSEAIAFATALSSYRSGSALADVDLLCPSPVPHYETSLHADSDEDSMETVSIDPGDTPISLLHASLEASN